MPACRYFSSALPRALLGAFPLSIVGMILERRVRPQAFAALFYTAIYSALPHKARTLKPRSAHSLSAQTQEVRFLFPVLPLFNTAAACALARAYNRHSKSLIALVFFLACVGLLLLTLAAKLVMSLAAYWNYPVRTDLHCDTWIAQSIHRPPSAQGGWGLQQLHAITCEGSSYARSVHVDVMPAMTGVSRFGERLGWVYSKTEGLSDAQLLARGFSHLLSSRPSVPGFTQRAAVAGFVRLRLQATWPPLIAVTEPQVYVLCRGV
jgi:alpha-1,6-mannosyltransferase